MHIVVVQDSFTQGRRWTFFENKAEFDSLYHPSWGKIVAEDISIEYAMRLCGATDQMIQQFQAGASYNVVVEGDNTSGGYFGNRVRLSCRDKVEFDAFRSTLPGKVIAEGVTDEKALDLLARVPPICRIMAAIESAHKIVERNHAEEKFDLIMSHAIKANANDRIYRKTRGIALGPTNPALKVHLLKLAAGTDRKAEFIREVVARYDFDRNDFRP